MKSIIAIDPGASGGIAWRDSEGTVHAEPMPNGMTAQLDRLRSLICQLAGPSGVLIVIEKTGTYRPGMSAPALCTFARHCGHLEAGAYCLGAPTVQVAPSVWQGKLGSLPRDKADRKRAIRDAMARLFPWTEPTLKTADALGILNWSFGQRDELP